MTSKRRLRQQVDELSALVDRMQRRWEAQQQAIADVAAALDAIKSRKGTKTVTNEQLGADLTADSIVAAILKYEDRNGAGWPIR